MHRCEKFWLGYDVTSVRPAGRTQHQRKTNANGSLKYAKLCCRGCRLRLFGGRLHRQMLLRKTKKKNLKTTKYKVNLCDQQRQDDKRRKKQIDS